MYDQPPEMITVSNFIEANRMASARGLFPSTQFYHATTAFVTPQTSQDKQIIAGK